MYPTRPDGQKLITLQEAAQKLAVSIDVLLKWNEINILKPTITALGQVGYTEEQVNHFLAIRKLSQENKNRNLSALATNDTEDNPSATYDSFSQSGTTSSSERKIQKYIYAGAISFFLMLGLLTTAFYQQDVFKGLLEQAVDSNQTESPKAVRSQTSNYSVSQDLSFSSPVKVQNKATNSNLTNEGKAILDNKISVTNQSATKTATVKAVKEISNRIGQLTTALATISSHVSTQNLASAPTYFSSNSTDNNSIFDKNGKIKGQITTPEVLGAAILPIDTISNDSLKQPDNNLVLIISGLGFAFFILTFGKQFLQPAKKTGVPDLRKARIFEIGQKTDGTVVLYFRGQEYKISKPELASESDQFIERLMEYAKREDKEIDYDIFEDEDLKVNTPLSKLVTRLGFVGIRRDLFFPRTSKNRVLFRKYITEDDLASLGLTIEQISGELLNFTQG
jgi:hypothetical protein